MHPAHIAAAPHPSQRVQTCTEHVRSVAALAKEHLSAVGLSATGEITGLLHDQGKFTAEFSAYLEKVSRGEKVARGSVIHSFAGVRYVLERFHSADAPSPLGALAAELIAVGIGSHHGLFDLWDERHQSGFGHRLSHQPEYDRRAIEAFHDECASADALSALFRQAEQEITAFYMQKMYPWIKSGDEMLFALGLLARLITSAVVDADRTDTRCFMEDQPLPVDAPPAWDACAERLRAYVDAFPAATPIQQARRVFSDCCADAAQQAPGLYRLDLPTGGGKTLAALRFAVLHARKHHMRRVFYIAPLLSIIDQNAESIREAVGDSVAVLEHHSNIVREGLSSEKLKETELLQENWDAPLIVTTLVRLLETLFSGKMSSVRRFHCLCGSVLIIDEVQSLPPRLLSLFNGAVNFLTKCCGATVVLCSATQPAFDSVHVRHRMQPGTRLVSEALCDRYAPIFRRTVITDAGSCDPDELSARALDILRTSDSLLIVCNTKREAGELYRRFADAPGIRCFHLSAGMCMAHRKQVLTDLEGALNAHEKLICVSTQLIEAGVDLSFGSVIRLSAGLDNIVQTAGRCNRHGEHDTPQPVYICQLKDERLGSLREIRQAQDALNALLAEFKRDPSRYGDDLASDAAVRDYYTALYHPMPENYQDTPVQGHTLWEWLSANQQFKPDKTALPAYHLGQAFRTAGDAFKVFDDESVSLLVPHADGADIIARLADEGSLADMRRTRVLLDKAKPYTVSVSAAQIERMMRKGMLCTLLEGSIHILNGEYYDDQTGLKEGNDFCSTLIL